MLTPSRSCGRRPPRKSSTPWPDIFNGFQARDTSLLVQLSKAAYAMPPQRPNVVMLIPKAGMLTTWLAKLFGNANPSSRGVKGARGMTVPSGSARLGVYSNVDPRNRTNTAEDSLISACEVGRGHMRMSAGAPACD